MSRRQHFIYPDPETMVAAFICDVRKFLESSVTSQRPLHLALSGGSTPIMVFRELQKATSAEEWSNVHIYWGDERCVPPDDPQSNFGVAREILLEPLGLSSDRIHRIMGENDPVIEAIRYGEILRKQLPEEQGVPSFDWIWLGLGTDGHTASIFPNQIELWKDDAPCVVATHPATGQKRVSVTGDVINASRRVTFLVTGEQKSAVINDIVMKEGKYLEYPAFYVNPSPGSLEWYMDKEATNWM